MPERLLFKDNGDIFYNCVENSSEAIMLTDTKGVLVYVNQAWQRIYGYSWDEAIGNSPRILRSPQQDDEFYRAMWAEIMDPARGSWRGELMNQAKDGTEVPVLLTITPYRSHSDAGTPVVGYMGIAIDLTERKQLQAQLMHQDRLASVGLLASGLAHEIGTPLGVIRGRAEYLSMIAKGNQSITMGLDIIIGQIDRISKLIYSLLNLARVTRSETAHSVCVQTVMDNVTALILQPSEKYGIQIINEIPDDALVKAEPDRLEQVILNLSINAVHAIESALSSGRNNNHFIKFTAQDRAGFWEIRIEDTGCGIAKSNHMKLFTPFFTTKEIGKGTGLGLAICFQIVQSWGGMMEFESEEGQGTTFTIRLPKG